jgi:hypothetical protein
MARQAGNRLTGIPSTDKGGSVKRGSAPAGLRPTKDARMPGGSGNADLRPDHFSGGVPTGNSASPRLGGSTTGPLAGAKAVPPAAGLGGATRVGGAARSSGSGGKNKIQPPATGLGKGY